MDPQHPTTFVKTELERALSEQSFGISAYAIVSSTELEATAVVTLLEGRTLSVVLTPRGYEFTDHSACCTDIKGVIFESVEDLLRSVSALYCAAHGKALLDRLSTISTTSHTEATTRS